MTAARAVIALLLVLGAGLGAFAFPATAKAACDPGGSEEDGSCPK